MASAYVQDLGTKSDNNTNATIVVTLSATPAPNNTLVIEVGWNGAGTIGGTGITDSKGNTWTTVQTQAETTAVKCNSRQSICQMDVAPLVSADTVTVTYTISTTTQKSAAVREYAHMTKDVTTSGQSTTAVTALNSGTTATTTQATEIVLVTTYTGAAEASWTKDATYTLPTASRLNNTNAALLSEYKDISSTGAQNATGTIPTAATFSSVICTYKVGISYPPRSARRRTLQRM